MLFYTIFGSIRRLISFTQGKSFKNESEKPSHPVIMRRSSFFLQEYKAVWQKERAIRRNGLELQR